jgi:hypothetical protein
MFEVEEMKEARERVVEIKEARAPAFREVLRFLYQGQVEDLVELADQLQLYELGNRYLMEDLKVVCVDKLLALCVTLDNVLELYFFAKLYEIQDLVKSTETFLLA